MEKLTPREELQKERRRAAFLVMLEKAGMTEDQFLEKYRGETEVLTDYYSPVGRYAQAMLGRIEFGVPKNSGINHGDYAIRNYRQSKTWLEEEENPFA